MYRIYLRKKATAVNITPSNLWCVQLLPAEYQRTCDYRRMMAMRHRVTLLPRTTLSSRIETTPDSSLEATPFFTTFVVEARQSSIDECIYAAL